MMHYIFFQIKSYLRKGDNSNKTKHVLSENMFLQDGMDWTVTNNTKYNIYTVKI